MSKTTLQILTEARELIADPSRWCKFAMARDVNQKSVGSITAEAVSWCAYGAAIRVEYGATSLRPTSVVVRGDVLVLLERAAQKLCHSCPPYVNDFMGHAAVLKVYDK